MKYLNRLLTSALLAFALAVPVSITVTAPVQAAALTDFAENKIVDATLRAQAIGTPITWYVALYTTCPTDSTAGTEATGGAYARVAVTAGLDAFAGTQGAATTVASTGTTGTTSNNAVWTFPTPTATWGTVVCWAITDAATLGNIWIYSALTVNKTINTGDAVSFAIGAATFQIDN